MVSQWLTGGGRSLLSAPTSNTLPDGVIADTARSFAANTFAQPGACFEILGVKTTRVYSGRSASEFGLAASISERSLLLIYRQIHLADLPEDADSSPYILRVFGGQLFPIAPTICGPPWNPSKLKSPAVTGYTRLLNR